MIRFKLNLRALAERWRVTSRKTRIASTEITNLTARGHMNGMSDGLDLAASDVDTLLDKPDPPTEGADVPE